MALLADESGQSGAKKVARRLIVESDVHALLLYGAPGAGQEDIALALAKAWLCNAPTPSGACGTCQSCGAFERGNNPDFELIKPYGLGQMIKQGAIVAETPPPKKNDFDKVPVRDFVRTGPLMSRLKVVAFFGVEKMNSAASNAFLKTLEEPQSYVRFLLVTDSVGRIMPTILSRCLAVACEMSGDPTGESAAPHLTAKLGAETVAAFEALAAGLGSAPAFAALKFAEDLEILSENLEIEGGTSRQALADALEVLASLVARSYPGRPEWIQLILLAHQRVLGNVHPGRVLDALFTEMLA